MICGRGSARWYVVDGMLLRERRVVWIRYTPGLLERIQSSRVNYGRPLAPPPSGSAGQCVFHVIHLDIFQRTLGPFLSLDTLPLRPCLPVQGERIVLARRSKRHDGRDELDIEHLRGIRARNDGGKVADCSTTLDYKPLKPDDINLVILLNQLDCTARLTLNNTTLPRSNTISVRYASPFIFALPEVLADFSKLFKRASSNNLGAGMGAG